MPLSQAREDNYRQRSNIKDSITDEITCILNKNFLCFYFDIIGNLFLNHIFISLMVPLFVELYLQWVQHEQRKECCIGVICRYL